MRASAQCSSRRTTSAFASPASGRWTPRTHRGRCCWTWRGAWSDGGARRARAAVRVAPAGCSSSPTPTVTRRRATSRPPRSVSASSTPAPLSVVLGTSGVVLAALPGTRRCRGAGPRLLSCRAGRLAGDGRDALRRRLARWLHDGSLPASFDALVGGSRAWEPGAEGLLYLPYLAGERTPHADPDARGAFTGSGCGTTGVRSSGPCSKASSSGCGTRSICSARSGPRPGCGRVSGGGARSRLWLGSSPRLSPSRSRRPRRSKVGVRRRAARRRLRRRVRGGTRRSPCVRVRETVEPDPAGRPRTRRHPRYRALYRRCRGGGISDMSRCAGARLDRGDQPSARRSAPRRRRSRWTWSAAATRPSARGVRGRAGPPAPHGSYEALLGDRTWRRSTSRCRTGCTASGRSCGRGREARAVREAETGIPGRWSAAFDAAEDAAWCSWRRSCTAIIRRAGVELSGRRVGELHPSAPRSATGLTDSQHPGAHRARRRRADGRGCYCVSGSRLVAGEPRRLRPGLHRQRDRLALHGRSVSGTTCWASSIAPRRCRTATSSRRSARKARSSSTIPGTAGTP